MSDATMVDGFNALNFPAPPDGSWASTNLSEALPGVASPLCWSLWAEAGDRAARAPFRALGAIDAADAGFPARSEDRIVNLFYGRIAVRVDYFCRVGDLVPGASGEAIARDAFGFVPPDFVPQKSLRRVPQFLTHMPVAFARTPGTMWRIQAAAEASHPVQLARTRALDLDGARQQLLDASKIFVQTMSAQAIAIACVIQPVFTAVSKLATDAGIDPAELMRGQGSHEEAAVIEDLWELSRGRMALEDFLRLHGYHGPLEGELSSRTWREDLAPLLRQVEAYKALPESESPAAKAAGGEAARERAEAELLAGLPASKRGGAKLVLRLGRKHLPLRSVGKIAYLRTFDVARAAARRAGALLAADGVLADPEDVFYLTVPELTGAVPKDVQAVVAERRAIRAAYEELELDVHWTGPPVPRPAERGPADVDRIEGLGVSPGVVEGPVVVVGDPADTEMDGGEVLVAHTTDPSYASLMFLSSALVVDIGGMLSHAAVVAREIGVPCVMDSKVGTRALRTGDVVRVDGRAGTVEVLSRVSTAAG